MSVSLLESLKNARRQTGLTQKEVEAKLNLRSLQLRDYETGRLKLPTTIAIKLANLYQLSLDELVGNTKKNKTTKQALSLFSINYLFKKNYPNIVNLDPVIRGNDDAKNWHWESPCFKN